MYSEHSFQIHKEQCSDPNCEVESSDLKYCECGKGFCRACADTEFHACEDCGSEGCGDCVVYSREFEIWICGGCLHDKQLEAAATKAKTGSIFAFRNYLKRRS